MRYRKKLTKGLSISLGKKKSSVNIGGLNIPLKTKKTSPKTGTNEGSSVCLNAFAIFGGIIIILFILVAIFGKTKDVAPEAKRDSTTVVINPIPHKHKRRHKSLHSPIPIDSALSDSISTKPPNEIDSIK